MLPVVGTEEVRRLRRTGTKRIDLHDAILEAIRVGQYRPDQRLPSEEELARSCGASRPAVREALTRLEHGGYIVRRHGRGTYIAPRSLAVEGRIDRLTTLTEVIQEQGYAVSIVDWSVDDVIPPHDVAADLELGRRARAWMIRRTYLAGRRRAAYCVGYIPHSVSGHTTKVPSTPTELRWHLEGQLPGPITHSVTSIEAVGATDDAADALELPAGTPLLLNRQLFLLGDGHPAMLGLNYADSLVLRQHVVQVRGAASPPPMHAGEIPEQFGAGAVDSASAAGTATGSKEDRDERSAHLGAKRDAGRRPERLPASRRAAAGDRGAGGSDARVDR